MASVEFAVALLEQCRFLHLRVAHWKFVIAVILLCPAEVDKPTEAGCVLPWLLTSSPFILVMIGLRHVLVRMTSTGSR